MSWLDLGCFIVMSILCNTVLPIPFDPVLISFASSQDPADAVTIALVGSVCAGIAAAADVTLFKRFHERAPQKWLALLPRWKGRYIYFGAFMFALLPLPFSVVRLAVLRDPPELIPYQLVVTLGRFPRYLLTLLLWPTLGLPRGGAMVLMAVTIVFATIAWLRKRSTEDGSGSASV